LVANGVIPVKGSGLFEAIRWMEERIGTSLDSVGAGDPKAIVIMERKMLIETLKTRKTIEETGEVSSEEII